LNRKTIIDTLKQSPTSLSVGILTADRTALDSAINLLEDADVPLLHLDVMDGKIWPKKTVGPSFLDGLETTMFKDVHLLIDKPEEHIESFAKAGADIIAFSIEYCADVGQTLKLIDRMENANVAERGILRGVSLNPDTPVDTIRPVIDDVDVVVLLAVGPETGKQNFISDLPGKIEAVKELSNEVVIFVDGAIKKDNVAHVATLGAEVVVTGSAVFDGIDPAKNLTFMLEAIRG
jgi:ribulose-phosphate 3-epimerase